MRDVKPGAREKEKGDDILEDAFVLVVRQTMKVL